MQNLAQIISNTNKALVTKQNFLKKKWYHLRTSNLGETEYRIKEKSLQRSEIDEINDIKEDLLKKLCSLSLPGFISKEELAMERNDTPQSTARDIKRRYELEERSYLIYKKGQMLLIDRLLGNDFTNLLRGNTSANSARIDNTVQELQVKKRPLNTSNIARREKKATVIKLSKCIKNEISGMEREDISSDTAYLHSLKNEDFFKISSEELDSINAIRTDKSYYDEGEIDESFHEMKKFIMDLHGHSDFNVENLTDEQMGKLVDAVSFTLNGVHYYEKFKKSKSMIHPIDILYILSRFK